MEAFNKYAGEVPFEPVKGVVFRFTHGDLSALADKYGNDYLKKWEQAAQTFNAKTIADFVERAWKGVGGSTPPKKDNDGNPINFDDPPWPLSAVVNPIYEALTWAVTGKTKAERLADAEAGA